MVDLFALGRPYSSCQCQWNDPNNIADNTILRTYNKHKSAYRIHNHGVHILCIVRCGWQRPINKSQSYPDKCMPKHMARHLIIFWALHSLVDKSDSNGSKCVRLALVLNADSIKGLIRNCCFSNRVYNLWSCFTSTYCSADDTILSGEFGDNYGPVFGTCRSTAAQMIYPLFRLIDFCYKLAGTIDLMLLH